MLGPNHQAKGHWFLLALVFALVALASLGASGPLSSGEGEDAPLPFDPPTLVEQADAREIALTDSRVHDDLSERHAFLGAALHTQKLSGTPTSDHPRLFDAWFYDYEADHVVWVVVDPAAARVVEIVSADPAFQPPLVGSELAHAVELAFEIDAMVARFPDGPPPATAILVSGEGTVCPTNRCALLGFIEDGGPAMDFLVLVNLSEDRVMEVAPPEDSWQEVYRA